MSKETVAPIVEEGDHGVTLCSHEGFPGLARGSSYPRGLVLVPLGPHPRSVGVSSSSVSNVTSSPSGAAIPRGNRL